MVNEDLGLYKDDYLEKVVTFARLQSITTTFEKYLSLSVSSKSISCDVVARCSIEAVPFCIKVGSRGACLRPYSRSSGYYFRYTGRNTGKHEVR